MAFRSIHNRAQSTFVGNSAPGPYQVRSCVVLYLLRLARCLMHSSRRICGWMNQWVPPCLEVYQIDKCLFRLIIITPSNEYVFWDIINSILLERGRCSERKRGEAAKIFFISLESAVFPLQQYQQKGHIHLLVCKVWLRTIFPNYSEMLHSTFKFGAH